MGLVVVALVSRIAAQVLISQINQDSLFDLRLKMSAQIARAPLRQLEEQGSHRLLSWAPSTWSCARGSCCSSWAATAAGRPRPPSSRVGYGPGCLSCSTLQVIKALLETQKCCTADRFVSAMTDRLYVFDRQ
ncbi:hypothetical protein HMI51_13515 [Corallococcus coralloides]|nr:hypothetical protein [Corallococcus coralloides]